MSSRQLQSEEELRKEEFKGTRENDVRTEMRGMLRAALLPFVLLSGRDLFAPIDLALGIDRRAIMKEELQDFMKLLDLKLEDTYGVGQECAGDNGGD